MIGLKLTETKMIKKKTNPYEVGDKVRIKYALKDAYGEV